MIALKKLLLPLAILPLIATVAFYTQNTVKSENTSLKNSSLKSTSEKILTLVKCTELVEQNLMGGARECYKTEFINAWKDKNFVAFNSSLTEQLRLNGKSYQPCHDGGHKAGYEILDSSIIDESVITLALNKENACGNGFIHGLFDGIGNKEGITVENWWELAKTCNNLPELSQRNLCADGSGHGAFQLTHDIVKALTLCSKHPDSATKDTCMQGVYMQIVRPDHDQNYPAVIKPSELENKWFDLCSSLAEKNLNKDFAYNCKIILSKLLSHRMIEITTNWDRGNAVDNQKIVNYLKKAVASALNQCSKFTDEIRTACNEDLALMSIYVTQSQKDLQLIYCKNFKGLLQQKCLSAKPEGN